MGTRNCSAAGRNVTLRRFCRPESTQYGTRTSSKLLCSFACSPPLPVTSALFPVDNMVVDKASLQISPPHAPLSSASLKMVFQLQLEKAQPKLNFKLKPQKCAVDTTVNHTTENERSASALTMSSALVFTRGPS
jgi:hypothetical protein